MADEEPVFIALRDATDQYCAGLRDLAEETPGVPEFARAMAAMIRGQFPSADGRSLIAAAQAANGACALIKQGGGELDAAGVINLIALAGRELGKEPGDG